MKNWSNRPLLLVLFVSMILGFNACSDDEMTEPTYQVPATYNFEHVGYTGQIQRLAQLTELKTYMATSQVMGTTLDPERLLAMYSNDAATAQWQGTYDASKELQGKTFENVRADFDVLLGELAAASQSVVSGSEGVSGVIESLDGSSTYLIGEDGLDHAQVIEKGLMGACFYYQATAVYMGSERMDVDNTIIEPGEGTAMEHHWDEAFGYLGVPIDFPTNLDGLAFWGNYSNKRNEVLGCNQTIMNAMLKGRAAISNDDMVSRDEAIAEAREIWELVAVGSALHYLNEGVEKFDDKALALHGLSEAIGFVFGLQFNPSAKVTNAQVSELLTLIAGADDFSQMNLYQTNVGNLQQARDLLADYYGLSELKDNF